MGVGGSFYPDLLTSRFLPLHYNAIALKQYYSYNCSMKITPSEYAKRQGISLQAVTKKIRSGVQLKGISKIEKFGRFYLLTTKKNERDLLSN